MPGKVDDILRKTAQSPAQRRQQVPSSELFWTVLQQQVPSSGLFWTVLQLYS
ncbi:MAG: hypothetical protein ACFCBU_06225 [Cyanophyceae cyanobacterium]